MDMVFSMDKRYFARIFILVSLIFLFCGVVPVFSQTPRLGQATQLQQELNRMPAVPIAGNSLRFQFGGDTWIATNNGRNFLAGTVTSYDTDEGSYLILKQTHTYLRVAWVATPGPDIIFAYLAGPPASLRTISRSDLPPDLEEASEE
jgi:hypothetical protein